MERIIEFIFTVTVIFIVIMFFYALFVEFYNDFFKKQ